jgi:hypothetical protein
MRATIGKWLATAACLAMGTAAAAQTVTPKRIVAFGDSYADDDNLFRILGIPNPPVYPTGRFSGGTNFVDTLSQSFGAEQVNSRSAARSPGAATRASTISTAPAFPASRSRWTASSPAAARPSPPPRRASRPTTCWRSRSAATTPASTSSTAAPSRAPLRALRSASTRRKPG